MHFRALRSQPLCFSSPSVASGCRMNFANACKCVVCSVPFDQSKARSVLGGNVEAAHTQNAKSWVKPRDIGGSTWFNSLKCLWFCEYSETEWYSDNSFDLEGNMTVRSDPKSLNIRPCISEDHRQSEFNF